MAARYQARIDIRLKTGVLDPQGAAVERALSSLGFSGMADVRQGKMIELVIEANDEASARAKLDDACKQLLANPVIETYSLALSPS